ncbi:MAG: hypothetical protein C7B43_14995 [Sulfobacillus benefaciens]|uniref:Uncharacterized protein n=1 Tax=Sulfobacillus benefaciens TaxID=453960 RepID=A0A2T2WV65_9FIRM|nr:MAG: hypothetical protein C7B43_14995 [Sulfobacillus benefaciens]HBQ95726.1 hypothetical protein [Sulfobacillus sp.]
MQWVRSSCRAIQDPKKRTVGSLGIELNGPYDAFGCSLSYSWLANRRVHGLKEVASLTKRGLWDGTETVSHLLLCRGCELCSLRINVLGILKNIERGRFKETDA